MTRLAIVDDDRTMISLLGTLLEMDGYEVIRLYEFEELREYLTKDRPDLLLMDVFVSDGDGLEVLSEVRANPALKNMPVIMSSGMNLAAECEAKGASAFLLKPYTPDQLLSTLTSLLNDNMK